MPSGWVGVESLALVCPGAARKLGVAAAPPSLQVSVPTTSVTCSWLPVSSCLSLGAQALGKVRPPALQIQPPQPSSLMVGEVPPEPDWLALAAKQVASSKFIF